ncbi:hypothetical protein BT96DRAFT_936151 [Gymnopus androsaceus JB14]|uniref:Uncharacterized protein n=1 Tax=Gymnopus androsaceus JB14 TaxID=1447944 RepID=A0A6A4I056_9AGAR|nr:hypothetical protein BT96DRAFT_936151 [Gymnopus androsaceus JB14]
MLDNFNSFANISLLYPAKSTTKVHMALNNDALLVAALAYASGISDKEMTEQELSDELFSEMAVLVGESGTNKAIPEHAHTSRQPRPLRSARPDLRNIGDDKLVQWTCFTLQDLEELVKALKIPDPFITEQRDNFSALKILTICCN